MRNTLTPLPEWRSTSEADLLRSRIVHWACQIKAWGIKWHTGIYPGEMAAFLGLCDVWRVSSIIESGRGDHAYSTQVLCEYAEKANVKVVSIDFQPVQGRVFEERLQACQNLRCVAGNTFRVLPKLANSMPGPIALLLDGPKLLPANRLSLVGSVMFDVKVVAHHNCPLEAPWGREFSQMFPGAFHYEDVGLSRLAEWQEFKEWEAEWVGHYEVYDVVHQTRGRSLEASSLALAIVADNRPSFKRFFEFQLRPLQYHPFWLWIKWSVKRRGAILA